MPESKLATFKIHPDRWESFIARASEQGTNASALLKRFVDSYLEGSIDLPSPQSQVNLDALLDQHLAPIKDELAELRGKLQQWSSRSG